MSRRPNREVGLLLGIEMFRITANDAAAQWTVMSRQQGWDHRDPSAELAFVSRV
jgi:hypothetical protein